MVLTLGNLGLVMTDRNRGVAEGSGNDRGWRHFPAYDTVLHESAVLSKAVRTIVGLGLNKDMGITPGGVPR